MPKKNNKEKKPDVCFIIMPFGGWFDKYYEEIYKPAIEKAGLEPHRADDLYGPNNVVSDIWEYTNKAKIVLADLTGKNPNVFYELGLAHALPRPVILISDSDQDIPFDLRAIRFIRYDKNEHDWGEKIKSSIISSIKEILKDPEKYIPAPFLKVRNTDSSMTVTPQEKELIEIKQDLNLLKKEVYTQSRRSLRDRIPESEARMLLEEYVKNGTSDDDIMRRLTRLGAPSQWIRRQIESTKRPSSLDDF